MKNAAVTLDGRPAIRRLADEWTCLGDDQREPVIIEDLTQFHASVRVPERAKRRRACHRRSAIEECAATASGIMAKGIVDAIRH